MATTNIDNAMTDLANYIGSNDNADKMLMDIIERNGGLSSNQYVKEYVYKDTSIGAKILDEFTKISKAKGGDYTIFLYNTAHIPAKYDGYTDEINFVDLIRDKMSNVNKAIYTKLSNDDPKFAKKCFCAMKNGDTTTTNEGIMESIPYNLPFVSSYQLKQPPTQNNF